MSQQQRPPEAFRSPSLFEDGMGYVCVSRFKSGGRVETGVFLVDTFCLGVKDALFEHFVSIEEYKEFLEELFAEEPEAMTPAAARRLVEQAVAYAASLGIAPAADYKKGCRVFGGIRAEDSDEEFTFGKDGKPFFMSGPNDSPARCEKILSLLEAHCGAGNYDYLIGEEMPDSDMDGIDDEIAAAELEDMAALYRATHPGTEVILNPPGLPKMSDLLSELIEPWADAGMDLRDAEMLLQLAMIAWNYSLLPEAEQKPAWSKLEEALGEEGIEFLKELIARKNELFPDDPRFVTRVDVHERAPSVYDIRAAYVLKPADFPHDFDGKG